MAKPRPRLPPVTSARRGRMQAESISERSEGANERRRSTILGRMFGAEKVTARGASDDLRSMAESERPRWYGHSYNRAGLYRLAEALGWMPPGPRPAPAPSLRRLPPRWVSRARAGRRTTPGA